MYLIVGLGNPESEYSGTRHNMGFDAINLVVRKLELGFFNYDKKADAEIIRVKVFDKDCIFLKPQTYMNLSGDSIRKVIHYYKVPKENIIIVYDDMDTPKAQIRIRETGGAGGHNGIKSVLSAIQDFTRIRIGIGKCTIDSERAQIDYVTEKISEEEKKVLREGVDKASDAIIDILKTDIKTVMNKYNQKESLEEDNQLQENETKEEIIEEITEETTKEN